MALTIPTGWTQSTGCLTSGDQWQWALAATPTSDWVDMLGGPDERSACYPPGYQPTSDLAFAADKCPDAFTSACTNVAYGVNILTVCCPTAYPFSCGGTFEFDIATMHCMSDFRPPNDLNDVSTLWKFTKTGFGRSLGSVESYLAQTWDYSVTPATKRSFTTTGSFVTEQYRTNGILWAMAVLITSTSSSSEQATVTGQATSSQSTATSPMSLSTDLSAGAAAGIGVGAGTAVLLFACGVWVMYRRRVAARRIQNGGHGDSTAASEQPKSPQNEDDIAQPLWGPPSELDHRNERPYELGPMSPRHIELD